MFIQPTETEPFDEALDRRIWSLSVEKMQWDKELAERRREVPVQMESLLEDILAQAGTEAEDPPYSEEQDSTIMDEGACSFCHVALYKNRVFCIARLPREAEVLDLCKRVMGVHEGVQKASRGLYLTIFFLTKLSCRKHSRYGRNTTGKSQLQKILRICRHESFSLRCFRAVLGPLM